MRVLQIKKPMDAVFSEKETGKPLQGQALIQMKRVGICGSDIHIFKGSNPFTIYPRIIGHEMAGEVFEINGTKPDIKIGTHVVIDPVLNCGKCDTCKRHHPNVCANLQVMGVHTDGGFSEQIIVPLENLYKVSDFMNWETAVLVEPFSIGFNVCERTAVCPEDRVLIIGSGVIGNTAMLTAKMLGAKVIVCDIDDKKLFRAKELGADYVVNSKDVSLNDKINELTNGDGVTVVIDAACIPSLFQLLLECAAPGGRVGILGFSKDFSQITQFEITKKELTVVGSRLSNRMFSKVINAFEQGLLNPEVLIEGIYPFTEAQAILKHIADSGSGMGKNIISFQR